MSANATQPDIDTAMAAGFSGHITKPLKRGTLMQTVQRMLPSAAAHAVPWE